MLRWPKCRRSHRVAVQASQEKCLHRGRRGRCQLSSCGWCRRPCCEPARRMFRSLAKMPALPRRGACAAFDDFVAGQILKADEALALGIRFVEFKGQRAGQIVELSDKAADDLIARLVKTADFTACRLQYSVCVCELDDTQHRSNVALRVGQVERLADEMVGGAVEPPAGERDATQRLCERAPVGYEQRKVEEPARVARARRRGGVADELDERGAAAIAGAEPHAAVGGRSSSARRPIARS